MSIFSVRLGKSFSADTVKPNNVSLQYVNSLPLFLLTQYISILQSSVNQGFQTTCYVDKHLWSVFFCLTRLSIPSKLPVVVDGLQYSPKSEQLVLQFNLTHLLSDARCSVFTYISNQNFSVSTVSTIFKSCVWLERELSDFTNLNFIGLVDTRRLLLDYFEPKCMWQTHINNDKNFNNTLYDITLSY